MKDLKHSSRDRRGTVRRAVAAATGVASAVAALGWPAVGLLATLILIMVAGGRWILSDDQRTRRLATLIQASRR